jgi:mannose-6-phosphate isomerase class I
MKKALLIATVLFIAVISTACINNIAVQELNNKAAEYMQKGDYESAINRLQASLDLDATMYETYYNLGIAATNAKKYDNAIEALNNGIKIKPDFANFYYSLGVAQAEYAEALLEDEVYDKEKEQTVKRVVSDEDKIKADGLKKTAVANLEKYLEFVNVKKGDFIYIPAGTVHAIGSGLRLLEVQQSCDLTYRLYDWGRGREVHIEKGLSVIKYEDMMPVAPFAGEFDCKYFSLETVNVKGGWSILATNGNEPKDVQLLYVISSQKAVIKTGKDKFPTTINAEEIYAILPGEKITIEGTAQIMRIRAK